MYEEKTPEAIKAEILKAIEPDWDTREGSFADDMLGPVALEISKVYDSLNAVQSMVWVDKTSGPYLDLAAEDLGIVPRKAGTKANVELAIAGEEGYTVPAGTTFLTKEDQHFLTLEMAIIPVAGVVLVAAEAREAGTVGNVSEDSITLQFSNASQITAVTNPAAAAGGADEESDLSLFARIDLARKKPRTSGNLHDYEEWALETPGVETVRVFPRKYGRGTVMVLIADGKRKPVDPSIVEACQAHIETEMPIGGIELTVNTPEEVEIEIRAFVKTDETTTLETIQADFSTALQQYFSDVSLADYQVVYNKVGALLINVAGVVDYADLRLNSQAGDITLTDEQSPIVGEVILSLL